MMFIPNPKFPEIYQASQDGRKKLSEAAAQAKTLAEQTAPRDSGDYAASFEIVEEDGEVRLGNTDFKAHWVEWGTVNMPPRATIRRATQSAGFRLDES